MKILDTRFYIQEQITVTQTRGYWYALWGWMPLLPTVEPLIAPIGSTREQMGFYNNSL